MSHTNHISLSISTGCPRVRTSVDIITKRCSYINTRVAYSNLHVQICTFNGHKEHRQSIMYISEFVSTC